MRYKSKPRRWSRWFRNRAPVGAEHQPAEGAFHDPAVGQSVEAGEIIQTFDDLDRQFEAECLDPLNESFAGVAAIHPQNAQPGEPAQHPAQKQLGPVAFGGAGRSHDVHRSQGFPVLASQPQGFGQRPGVQMVGLVAAGSFTFTIAFGTERIDRINTGAQLQQLVHHRPLTGLNGDGQSGIWLHLIAELLPAGQGVFDAKFGDELTLAIHNDDIVMIAGPVEAGIMGDFISGFHGFAFGCARRGAVGSHPDTQSLAGGCSLRHCDSRYRGGR